MLVGVGAHWKDGDGTEGMELNERVARKEESITPSFPSRPPEVTALRFDYI